MKKVLFLFVIFFVGCTNNLKKEEISTKTTTLIDKTTEKELKYDYLLEIDSNKFFDLISSENNSVFYIGRDTCPACKKFKPVILRYSNDKKFIFYYLNLDNISDEDMYRINDFVEINYIPSLLIVSNKQTLYNEAGIKSYEELDLLLDKYKR